MRRFFDMVDRRYNKEWAYKRVFTSNKSPTLWRKNSKRGRFAPDAIDCIFDDATVFSIRVEAFAVNGWNLLPLQTRYMSTPVVAGASSL